MLKVKIKRGEMKVFNFKRLFLLCVLIIPLAGCDNNSTGVTSSDHPALPELEKSQPDLSYFEKDPTSTENSNFLQAKRLVAFGSSFLFIGSAYDEFIEAARNEDADFDGGVWIWNYSTQYQGVEAEMILTAQELDGGTEWILTGSFISNQGNRIEDYRFLEGTVSLEGTGGEWTFNALMPQGAEEIPVVITNWQITDETQKTITAEVYINGEPSGTISFEKDRPEYILTADLGVQGEVIIFWNTETNAGFIDQGGQRSCWGENFENVPCS